MKPVIGTHVIKTEGYRFKQSFFGNQILEIGEVLQDWDTNSGNNEGRPYVKWRKATSEEAYEVRKMLDEMTKENNIEN